MYVGLDLPKEVTSGNYEGKIFDIDKFLLEEKSDRKIYKTRVLIEIEGLGIIGDTFFNGKAGDEKFRTLETAMGFFDNMEPYEDMVKSKAYRGKKVGFIVDTYWYRDEKIIRIKEYYRCPSKEDELIKAGIYVGTITSCCAMFKREEDGKVAKLPDSINVCIKIEGLGTIFDQMLWNEKDEFRKHQLVVATIGKSTVYLSEIEDKKVGFLVYIDKSTKRPKIYRYFRCHSNEEVLDTKS